MLCDRGFLHGEKPALQTVFLDEWRLEEPPHSWGPQRLDFKSEWSCHLPVASFLRDLQHGCTSGEPAVGSLVFFS